MARCLICLVLLSAMTMVIAGCDSSSSTAAVPPKGPLTPDTATQLKKG
jgi:hypothetical protein